MTTIRDAVKLTNAGIAINRLKQERDNYRNLCDELLDDLKSAQAMLRNNLGCESIVNKAIVKAESILGDKNER